MNASIPKKQIPVILAGANRGGVANLAAFKQLNNGLIKAELIIGIIDPIPGRAETLATRAAEEGLKAIGGEEFIENIIFEGDVRPPIITAIDKAADNAQVIRNAEENGQTVAGQLLIKTRQDELFALRFHLRHKDNIARRQTLSLLEAMSQITDRKGGESVWGADGLSRHRLIEPIFRESYAQTLARDLQKTLFRLEPECYPLEISFDGKTAYPLVVQTNTKHLSPTELLEELPPHLYFPFGRGDSLVIAEIVDKTINLQIVSRRQTDDRLVISDPAKSMAVTNTDDKQHKADQYVEERISKERELLQARLSRNSLSLSQPITTTD